MHSEFNLETTKEPTYQLNSSCCTVRMIQWRLLFGCICFLWMWQQ